MTFRLCPMELLQLMRGDFYFHLPHELTSTPNKTHKTSETDAVQDWCIPFDFQQEHKEKNQ